MGFLLLAMLVPAGLLFLRIAFQIAASRAAWLSGIATACLALFFVTQAAGAWYMRRLLPAPRTRFLAGLQYAGLFVMGLFFSITGAVMLEAFGVSMFLHLRQH